MPKTPAISIYESTFAKSNKTDAILVVGKKKLHVNKALLSYHSDYFNTLFNGEFKEKSMPEIEIKDVVFEDFAALLSLIQEKPIEPNRQNSENLLKLADRFLLSGPKSHVEHFIWMSSEYSRIDKLKLADKYKLNSLLERALSLYNDRSSFSDMYYQSEILSSELKLRIFKMFFDKYSRGL